MEVGKGKLCQQRKKTSSLYGKYEMVVPRNTFLSPSEYPELFFLVTCPSLTASRSSRNPPSFQTQFWKQHFFHVAGEHLQSSISEGWARAFAPESDLKPCAHPAKPRACLGNTIPWAVWWENWRPGTSVVWPCNAHRLKPVTKILLVKAIVKKKGKGKKNPTNQTCRLSDW